MLLSFGSVHSTLRLSSKSKGPQEETFIHERILHLVGLMCLVPSKLQVPVLELWEYFGDKLLCCSVFREVGRTNLSFLVGCCDWDYWEEFAEVSVEFWSQNGHQLAQEDQRRLWTAWGILKHQLLCQSLARQRIFSKIRKSPFIHTCLPHFNLSFPVM